MHIMILCTQFFFMYIFSKYIRVGNILSLKSISEGCQRKFKLRKKIFRENENGIQRKGFDNKKCQKMIFSLSITDLRQSRFHFLKFIPGENRENNVKYDDT